jgi:hypothetical protein
VPDQGAADRKDVAQVRQRYVRPVLGNKTGDAILTAALAPAAGEAHH